MKKMRLRVKKKPMVPGPALDLNVLECQGETELPSVSHRGPDGFKKAPENDGEKDQRAWWLLGDHTQSRRHRLIKSSSIKCFLYARPCAKHLLTLSQLTPPPTHV